MVSRTPTKITNHSLVILKNSKTRPPCFTPQKREVGIATEVCKKTTPCLTRSNSCRFMHESLKVASQQCNQAKSTKHSKRLRHFSEMQRRRYKGFSSNSLQTCIKGRTSLQCLGDVPLPCTQSDTLSEIHVDLRFDLAPSRARFFVAPITRNPDRTNDQKVLFVVLI